MRTQYAALIISESLLLVAGYYHKWGINNNRIDLIMDMSTTCVDDLQSDIYLPFGMGVADASAVVISDNDLYPNCLLNFFTVGTDKEIHMIVVVEFPDRTEGPKVACQNINSGIFIKQPGDLKEIDVCDKVNEMSFGRYAIPSYVLIGKSDKLAVRISSRSLFETVKITATSARRLGQYKKCNYSSEILCSIGNTSLCISNELLCDDNINCGSAMYNDEDVRICDEARYKKLWLVVLSGIVMTVMTAAFCMHLLRVCIPTVPDSYFIFNEDEDNRLILRTRFTGPPESSGKLGSLPPRDSSFKFRNVPVAHAGQPPPTKYTETDTKVTLLDQEMVGGIVNEIVETQLDLDSYKDATNTDGSPFERASKKPRFQSDSINVDFDVETRPL